MIISSKNFIAFSFFMFFLSILRFLDNDLLGFVIFLLISFLFLFSYLLEHKRLKLLRTYQERKNTFIKLSSPKLSLRNEGESQIVTFIVPSLELFNEMTKDGEIKS